MGAAGTKPLNGETLGAGHTCAVRGDEDPACNCAPCKEKVVRLCQRDPHQLFQRLQGQLQELTLEVKVRLLEHLSRERPGLAQLFLTALLDNYDRLVTAAVSLAPAVHTLEHHHLSRFGLSWESLNKHAYQSVVYMDPMVQNNLPTFISQLRALLSGQEQQRVYADLVRRYLSFDDEMSTVAAQWTAAEARLQEFGQEQATLKAKQRMLREDWELLRAQRKLLQQQAAGAAHKHTYSKAAPTTHRPQPKFDPALEPAEDSSQNDSCSEQSSSTASQHCSCCYCEVFGHGVSPVAPVSRNYPEIRDRLRLRLDQRRRDNKSESSERSGGETSSKPAVAAQKRNEKRAAKRERQRVRRMDACAAQEVEQEQMRNIQEFQRRNPEVTITVVKSAGEADQAAAESHSPPPAASSPIMEGLARNGLVSVPCAGGVGDARMVTIRRVMEPGGKEPKVTITLKGDSPEKDRVLMTLVNGQLKNGGAEPAAAEPVMTKTAKKKLKKAARLQKLKEEEEAAERARLAAAWAAEQEQQRLQQLQQAKGKKKKKKVGATNGAQTAEKPAQPAKRASPILLNGKDADKWRPLPQKKAGGAERPTAPAARCQPEPETRKQQAATRLSKKAAAAAERGAGEPQPAAEPRRRKATADHRLEPPTQLMQDLALSSSDSEMEDLARAYRIPAGITISRVRGGAEPPADSGRLSPPPAAAPAADKKAKKKRKKKAAPAAADEAPAVPEVTIRKVAGSGPGRRAARSVDDYESVFMPAAGGDTITDLVDKEVEAFKRFCLDGPQVSREHRPKVNFNIKDILIKKKPL
ncbi:LOW QUALITY PROTEIN: protein FAM193A-like [Pollicipes pollicipes]|uniref:LOW QUALITY PROTEIN: protein FAM193A-like n=1 Tax=Pollicipes pollicipes TaxID=41117 RepID=UPI001885A071|nr:LOW QUALITY PROTEIN: protein FAM193A-like [Pollicipes pollicipes]